MTNQQILEKAIQKAIASGWDYRGFVAEDTYEPLRAPDVSIYEIIFNHDFAKALWGEEEIVLNAEYADPEDEDHYALNDHNTPISEEVQPAWQYHLQQMVIAEDPIKYLGEHLND